MPRRDANLLRAAALWTVFVWGVFIRNIVRDRTHSAGFITVHVTLAVVSIAFAAAVWRVAARGLERGREGQESGRRASRSAGSTTAGRS